MAPNLTSSIAVYPHLHSDKDLFNLKRCTPKMKQKLGFNHHNCGTTNYETSSVKDKINSKVNGSTKSKDIINQKRKEAIARSWLKNVSLSDFKNAIALYTLFSTYGKFCLDQQEIPLPSEYFHNLIKQEFEDKKKNQEIFLQDSQIILEVHENIETVQPELQDDFIQVDLKDNDNINGNTKFDLPLSNETPISDVDDDQHSCDSGFETNDNDSEKFSDCESQNLDEIPAEGVTCSDVPEKSLNNSNPLVSEHTQQDIKISCKAKEEAKVFPKTEDLEESKLNVISLDKIKQEPKHEQEEEICVTPQSSPWDNPVFRSQIFSRLDSFLSLKGYEKTSCYQKASVFVKLITALFKLNPSSFMYAFGHSMTCKSKSCNKVCSLFKHIFMHIRSGEHKCAIRFVYNQVLLLHLDTCMSTNCPLPNCQTLQMNRMNKLKKNVNGSISPEI